MVIKYLIQKEFLQIRRNSFIPRLIVLFPIIIMCVAPWVMDMEVKRVSVVVVDHDRSTYSMRLIQRIEASYYFTLQGEQPSYTEALREVERAKADIILEIPEGYERDSRRGASSQTLIATNAVNGTKGSIGSAYLSQIVASPTANVPSPISPLFLYNRHQDYKLYMIPALMAILIMMLCGFLPALNIVSEKESGTIEAINVTPVRKWEFILAKLIPYWLIALVVMSLCLLLAWLIYGISCAGSLGLVYLAAILLAFVFSGFGLVVSNRNDTMQQAVLVMWFFVVCLMLLSGLFTPVRSMPEWAYLTTYVNPVHYFIDAIRSIFIRGTGFSGIAHQLAALTAFALLMSLWAVGSYRKR